MSACHVTLLIASNRSELRKGGSWTKRGIQNKPVFCLVAKKAFHCGGAHMLPCYFFVGLVVRLFAFLSVCPPRPYDREACI